MHPTASSLFMRLVRLIAGHSDADRTAAWVIHPVVKVLPMVPEGKAIRSELIPT